MAGSIWARPVRSGRGPDPTYSREQMIWSLPELLGDKKKNIEELPK